GINVRVGRPRGRKVALFEVQPVYQVRTKSLVLIFCCNVIYCYRSSPCAEDGHVWRKRLVGGKSKIGHLGNHIVCERSQFFPTRRVHSYPDHAGGRWPWKCSDPHISHRKGLKAHFGHLVLYLQDIAVALFAKENKGKVKVPGFYRLDIPCTPPRTGHYLALQLGYST